MTSSARGLRSAVVAVSAILIVVIATWVAFTRQFGVEVGGPLLASRTGAQLESVVRSCSPVASNDVREYYVGLFSVIPDHELPGELKLTALNYSVSDIVTSHQPVVIVGDGIPPGYTMDIAGDSGGGILNLKDSPLVFEYRELPSLIESPFSGVGVLVAVGDFRVDMPDDPVISIESIEYEDGDGKRYSVPVERYHWVTRLQSGDEGFCPEVG